MGYADESGYVPLGIPAIMESIMTGFNAQFGTSYTSESFLGTNAYKYFYALAERVQTNEIKASEVFLKMQDYFDTTNETILVPKVTPNGLIAALAEAGYTASVKPMIEADAGKKHVCVDVDEGGGDYAAERLEICTIIKDYTVGGVVTMGTEEETLTLTNGQEFDFKFNLPDRIPILLRLTVTLSRNNQSVIDTPEVQKQNLLENIQAQYSLGKDFEPERYFSVADAPWCSDILLEYSTNAGADWDDVTFEAEYDELFTFGLADITLVES